MDEYVMLPGGWIGVGDSMRWEDSTPFYMSLVAVRKRLMLTHICSLLRTTFLRSPLLWNDIDLWWPYPVMEAFAFRAASSPLSLRIDSLVLPPQSAVYERIKWWAEFLSSNMHRVHHLELKFDLRELRGNELAIQNLWGRIRYLHAPKMEVFDFWASTKEEDELPDFDGLFSGHAPLLKELTLGGGRYGQFKADAFQSLVHIHLQFLGPQSLVSLTQIPFILAGSSRLETLNLQGVDRSFFETIPPEIRWTVELPKCSQVMMTGFYSDQVNYLFSSISFPCLTHVIVKSAIRLSIHGNPLTLSRSLFPHFMSLCSQPRFQTIRFRDRDIYTSHTALHCSAELIEIFSGLEVEDARRAVLQVVASSHSMFGSSPQEFFTKDICRALLLEASSLKGISLQARVSPETLLESLVLLGQVFSEEETFCSGFPWGVQILEFRTFSDDDVTTSLACHVEASGRLEF
ncbi:hypothetical protein SISNIDRAFT_488025 [Sistotremastrum niveocremeum HHB9708]|uniref:F-box domain-containing protein n=1 Tax=Sistotremastrum niveocremeum HHB9708 TaxID=1314777 RepID=A0A164RNE6_9AGAM|nr:hypothetical protein SISNIDRAFT_488025 [Sistotremastrum niveocremeum HHB9708]